MNEHVPVEYLSKLGAKGGKSRSEAKTLAARLNGLSGGRPCKIYIYGLVNLETGRVEYVGQTENIRQRMRGHVSGSGRKTRPIPFEIGAVVLCQTDEEHANECERAFWEHFKSFGECTMNGKEYVPYYARAPKWLPVNER